jgi:hypothetical protein
VATDQGKLRLEFVLKWAGSVFSTTDSDLPSAAELVDVWTVQAQEEQSVTFWLIVS